MLPGNRRKRGGQGGNGMMRNGPMQRKNFQPQFNAPQLSDSNGYMDFSSNNFNNFNEPQQPQQRQQMNNNKRKNPQNQMAPQQQQKRMRKNFQNGNNNNNGNGGGQNKNWNQNNNNNNRRMNQPNINNFQQPQFNSPPQMMNQRMPMRNNNNMQQFQGGPNRPMRGGPNMSSMGGQQMMRGGNGGNQGGQMRRPNFQGNNKFPPNQNQIRKNPNQLNKVTKAKARVLGNKPQLPPNIGVKKPINKSKKKPRDPYSLEAPFVTDEIKAEHAKKEAIMESMKGKGKNDELFNKFKEQRESFVKKYDEAKAAYLAEKKVGHG